MMGYFDRLIQLSRAPEPAAPIESVRPVEAALEAIELPPRAPIGVAAGALASLRADQELVAERWQPGAPLAAVRPMPPMAGSFTGEVPRIREEHAAPPPARRAPDMIEQRRAQRADTPVLAPAVIASKYSLSTASVSDRPGAEKRRDRAPAEERPAQLQAVIQRVRRWVSQPPAPEPPARSEKESIVPPRPLDEVGRVSDAAGVEPASRPRPLTVAPFSARPASASQAAPRAEEPQLSVGTIHVTVEAPAAAPPPREQVVDRAGARRGDSDRGRHLELWRQYIRT